MNHSYLIRDAEIADVYWLAQTLRDADRCECEAYGITPAKGLRRSFYASAWRRTALIDGNIAAMWGICGTAIGHTAQAWLMTAPVIERLPLAFIREARREARSMLDHHDRVEGTVDVNYQAAQRFLGLIGFTVEPEFVTCPTGRFHPFSMERTMRGWRMPERRK